MRTPRLYMAQKIGPDRRLRLGKDPSRHLLRVLRLTPGAAVILFDGAGSEYECRIESHADGIATLTVANRRTVNRESPLQLNLMQGLSRGSRMDVTVRKAVELGVTRIVPVRTARSVPKLDEKQAQKRLRRWRDIIISAAEQSGRTHLPSLASVAPLEVALSNRSAPQSDLALTLDPESKQSLKELRPTSTGITLLVGPEGGLSGEEINAARAAGFTGVGMGPRTLRTETAGLACIAAVQALWGDLA